MQKLGLSGLPVTKLVGSYDLPEELIRKPHSPAFAQFLKYWFVETWPLTRGEVDLAFLQELSPEELAAARQRIRINLRTRHNHIIDGAAALSDLDAVPLLRTMFDDELDESRRRIIGATLWRLTHDPLFRGCTEDRTWSRPFER